MSNCCIECEIEFDGDEDICPDCLEKFFLKCVACDEYFRKDECTYIDELGDFCGDCLERARDSDKPDYDFNGNSDYWRDQNGNLDY